MRSRWLLNVALAALVIGLAWLAWQRPGGVEEPLAPKLTDLSPEQVESILIEQSERQPMRLSKQADGTWVLNEPVRVRVLPYKVRSLLDLLTTPSLSVVPREKMGNPEQFGLTSASVRLTLNDLLVRFGGTNPIGMRRYVEVAGVIHLIDDRFYHHVRGDWTDWIDRQLIPQGISLQSIHSDQFQLTRQGGKWRLEPDLGAGADVVAQFVDRWKMAQAMRITPLQPRTGDPLPEINIVWQEGTPGVQGGLKLELSRTADEVILRAPQLSIQYHLTEEGARHLLEPPRPQPDTPPSQEPTPSAPSLD